MKQYFGGRGGEMDMVISYYCLLVVTRISKFLQIIFDEKQESGKVDDEATHYQFSYYKTEILSENLQPHQALPLSSEISC